MKKFNVKNNDSSKEQFMRICKSVGSELFGELVYEDDIIKMFLRSSELYLPSDNIIKGFVKHLGINIEGLGEYPLLRDILLNHCRSTLYLGFNKVFLAENFILFNYNPGIRIDNAKVLKKATSATGYVYSIYGLLLTDFQREALEYWCQDFNLSPDIREIDPQLAYGEAYSFASKVIQNAAQIENQINNKIMPNGIVIDNNPKWLIGDYIVNQMKLLSDIFHLGYGTYLNQLLSGLKDVVNKNLHDERLERANDVLNDFEKDMEEGRLCFNDNNIYDVTEAVEDIPADEFIRLSNGSCWNIYDLMDHMKSTNGLNSSRSLPINYPTKTLFGLWSLDHDLNRIFNHPKAQEIGFKKWYDNRNLKEYTDLISGKTMRHLKESMELLSSQGIFFEYAIKQELTSDEKKALIKVDGVIDKTGKYKDSIIAKMDVVLKTYANARLIEHLKKMTKVEKNALLFFREDLENIVTNCYNGIACNWYTADVLRDTYDEIARLKHIPSVVPNKGEAFVHVSPKIIDPKILE